MPQDNNTDGKTVRGLHKSLCDDLTDLDEVQHSDAMSPSTAQGTRWTTEVVLEPGIGIATSDVLDVIQRNDMGVAPPVLSRGNPPSVVLQVQRDEGRRSP